MYNLSKNEIKFICEFFYINENDLDESFFKDIFLKEIESFLVEDYGFRYLVEDYIDNIKDVKGIFKVFIKKIRIFKKVLKNLDNSFYFEIKNLLDYILDLLNVKYLDYLSKKDLIKYIDVIDVYFDKLVNLINNKYNK